MAFFKKQQQPINGLWYPQSVTVGKPVTTDQIAAKLAFVSTVTPGDAYAIVKNLGGVLGDYMADGRTVKLDGVGTFYYTAATNKNGVASPKEVSAKQIKGIRVRFIPEVHRNVSSQVTTRSMVNESNVFWEERQVASTGDSSSEEGGSGSGGGLDENPLG